MKIAVCEDSQQDLDKIKTVLQKTAAQLELDLDADYYKSGEALLGSVRDGCGYKLAILDIYMEEITGIETAKKLRELSEDIQIAFLISSPEHALESIDLNAVHYLIKPVTADKFGVMLERFFERMHTPLKTLELSSGDRNYAFPMFSVQKIQSSHKGVDIYLKNNEMVHIRETLINVEKQLEPRYFIKVSRGLIVQMSFILCMDKNICRFRDGTETLISRKDCAEIRRKYNDYLFQARGIQM